VRFCSNRCRTKYNNQNLSSKSKGVLGQIKDEFKEEEKTPEQFRVEAEERRRAEEQEQIKKERRKAKAQELKEDGKSYSAFLTQFGENFGATSAILAAIGAFFLFPAFQEDEMWMYLVGFGTPSVFIILWSFLGIKYLQEYFRK
jgi:hypothetical protein